MIPFITADVIVRKGKLEKKKGVVELIIKDQAGFFNSPVYFAGFIFRCSNSPAFDGDTVYLRGLNQLGDNDSPRRMFPTLAEAEKFGATLAQGLKRLNDFFATEEHENSGIIPRPWNEVRAEDPFQEHEEIDEDDDEGDH